MLHGHCRVHEHEGEELLEQWVQVQQMKEMRGTLGNEKQTLLNSLGVSWKSSWLESWKQLCLLKQHNGKIRVITLKTSKRTLPLYIWLRNQRLMQMEGSLDKDREELLKEPTPAPAEYEYGQQAGGVAELDGLRARVY